jgi:hypothetical protein
VEEKAMKCPRRIEGSVFNLPAEDNWEDGTCSYCGSISQELFLEAIEKGCKLGPTDKNYKVYVDEVEPMTRAKFYFQHLDAEGRTAFIKFFNAHKINIGSPGHFYVLPFFTRAAHPVYEQWQPE